MLNEKDTKLVEEVITNKWLPLYKSSDDTDIKVDKAVTMCNLCIKYRDDDCADCPLPKHCNFKEFHPLWDLNELIEGEEYPTVKETQEAIKSMLVYLCELLPEDNEVRRKALSEV